MAILVIPGLAVIPDILGILGKAATLDIVVIAAQADIQDPELAVILVILGIPAIVDIQAIVASVGILATAAIQD